MTTVINNPGQSESSSTGVIAGILVVVLLGILFLIFGLPYLRNRGTTPTGSSATLNVSVPTGGTSGGTSGGAAQ